MKQATFRVFDEERDHPGDEPMCKCGFALRFHINAAMVDTRYRLCPVAPTTVPAEDPRPTKHVTEQRFPEQCAEFRRITDKMYAVHLDKNADYSPMNILATGLVGLMTRLWDKTARMMNLAGFNIQTGEYSAPKEAKNESFEDSLLDSANYAIIGLIFLRKKWGR